MFDKSSRYSEIETATLQVPDDEGGERQISYVRRRFIPRSSESTVFQEHTTSDGERPDTIATTYLGDPTRFWQLCDANSVMHPEELTEEAGVQLRIPLPTL